MNKFLLILLVIIALMGVIFAGTYNGIVTKHESITANWAEVENQLQRRSDLIPNLVNSVKGYAAHEKNLFENITLARSQWTKASSIEEKVRAASGMDMALSRLLAVAENYPNLKSDQTFLKLMDELSGAENRIAVARMRYNEAVQSYNISVRVFPGNIIASVFGYKQATVYFKVKEEAKNIPEVKF